jgi:hypothetical protein
LRVPINVSELLSPDYGLLPLQSIWLKHWSVEHVYSRVTEEEQSKSNNIVIVVQRKLSRVNPVPFLKSIKNMLASPWTISLNNGLEQLKPHHAIFTPLGKQYRPEIFDSTSNLTTKPFQAQWYKRVYSSFKGAFKTQIITRLFFCDQVELHPSEFLLNYEMSILYSYTTKRYMFDGEFALVRSEDFGDYSARICIDDSGFNEKDQNAVNMVKRRNRNVGTVLKTADSIFACVLMIFFQRSII